MHGPRAQLTVRPSMQSFLCEFDVVWHDITTKTSSIMFHGSNDGTADAHIRVKHDIIFIRHGQNESLDKLYGELARVNRLFHMVRLDVWDDPKVAWIFPKRVARELA